MPEFGIRAEAVDVEEIMEQIRARIREKRGVDYTEQEIRALAAVKLEKMLEPRGLRTDLLEEFRRTQQSVETPEMTSDAVAASQLFASHRPLIRFARRLLRPILKLFINPTLLAQAVQREAARQARDPLYFELLHNLVIETTRLGIEIKNLKMRVESLNGRLEFSERRVRALEGVVVYKPSEDAPSPPRRSESSIASYAPAPGGQTAPSTSTGTSFPVGSTAQLPPPPSGEGPGQRSRRRRRRRGRRAGGAPAATVMGGTSPDSSSAAHPPSGGEPQLPAEPAHEPAGSDGPDDQQ